jgi:hypothetical protein
VSVSNSPRPEAYDARPRAAHISSSLWAAQRHGGVRRAEQVARDTAHAFPDPPILSCARMTRSWRVAPGLALLTAWRAIELLVRGVLSFRGFLRYLSYGTNLAQFIATTKPGIVVLELCPGVSMIAGDILARSRIPFVVFPQNLEFLVPGTRPEVTFRHFAGAYEIEALIYRRARKVFTISHFDATILHCLSVDAEVWPFYPTEDELPRLRRLRDARQRTAGAREDVLVLGTAINPPTRAGMNTLLASVRESKTWTRHINVVGFGTDTLDSGGAAHIHIVGPVESAILDRFMVDCAFAMIYQPPTTGFLTRLVELNLAGIPVAVVGGYEQAVGLERFGIFRFDRIDQIDPVRMANVPMAPISAPADARLSELLHAALPATQR